LIWPSYVVSLLVSLTPLLHVKKMIYKEIQKKQEAVDPEKFNMRIVEDNLAEVEAIQQIYAMILDEENRRKRGISLPEKPEEM
jgi:hypothetical protein